MLHRGQVAEREPTDCSLPSCRASESLSLEQSQKPPPTDQGGTWIKVYSPNSNSMPGTKEGPLLLLNISCLHPASQCLVKIKSQDGCRQGSSALAQLAGIWVSIILSGGSCPGHFPVFSFILVSPHWMPVSHSYQPPLPGYDNQESRTIAKCPLGDKTVPSWDPWCKVWLVRALLLGPQCSLAPLSSEKLPSPTLYCEVSPPWLGSER